MKNRLSNIAFRTAVLYGVLGAAWILLSDTMLNALFTEPSVIRNISLYKGWFFVLTTAVLLYFGLFKQIRRWEREAAERKITESALTTSNAQLVNALTIAHLGHWEYDVATDFFTFNDQFYQMHRTTAEEVGGYTMSPDEYARRFVHPDEISIVAREIQKAVETTDPHFNRQFEHRIVYADGAAGYVMVRFFIEKDNYGNTTRLYGVNQDITEYKKAEAAIHERLELETRLSKLTAAVPGVLFAFRMRPDGSISFPYISTEIETMFGLRPEDLQLDGKLAFKLIHPEDIGRMNESIRESARRMTHWHQEYRAQNRQGVEVWIEAQSTPERESDGSTLWYGFFHDITERKRAEEALKASEDKFSKAFWTSPDSVNINRMSDGLFIEINQGFTALTGYTPEEVIGKTSIEINIWADPKERERLRQGLREHGGVTNMEASFRMKDGSVRTGLMSARIITVNGTACILSITRDISERKLAEAALQASEEQYRILFESAPIGIGLVDMQGNLIAFNNAILQSGGYSREDIDAIKNVADLYFNPVQREAALSIFREKNELKNFPVQFKRKDGTPYDALLSLSLVQFKGMPCIQSTVQDVTELKRVELKIQENETRLSSIIDSAMDGIIIVDEKQRITLFNLAAEKMFGYDASDVIGQPLDKLIPDRFRSPHEQYVRSFAQTNATRRSMHSLGVVKGLRADGTEFPAEASISKIEVAGQRFFTAILRDITERRLVEEALRENEYLLRTSQEVAGIASYSFNVQTGIWLLSKNYNEIFGTSDTLVPPGLNGWIGSIHPDQKKEMLDYLTIHVIKEHNNFDKEYRIIRSGDRQERWIHQLGEIEFDESGNTKIITGVIQDITERKQAEDALRIVITGARCLLWRAQVVRRGTEYHWKLHVSNEDAAMEFLPVLMLPEQSYSDAWQKSKFEEERVQLDRNYRDALEHKRPGYYQEFRCRLKDGSIRWLYEDVRITPTMQDQWELVGVCTDITEQKWMREALQESNRKLSTTVNNLQGLVYRCANDSDWTMEYISEGIVELTGYLANEFIMNRVRSYNSIIEPEDRTMVWEEIQKAIASRETYTIEYRIRTSSGERKWVWERGRGIFDHDRLLALEGFITDITERKRAETALRESEYLLRKSQEIGGLGSYYLDVRTGKWQGSKKLDDLFGIDDTFHKDVEGWIRLIHPDERENISQYFAIDVIKNRNSFDKEYRIIRRNDGKERWLHGYGELEFDDNGNVKAMIGTIQDITERKQTEEARLNLETQLRQSQKLESLGTLAAGIAHDFNNILGILLGYTSVLPKQHEQPEKFEHSVATMTAAVKRGASIVRQLLTFARKTDVENIPVDINEMIIELSKLLNETLSKTISIELSLYNSLPIINADASQIHQVLLNLCVNARDAMPKGGTLSLVTSVIENQQIRGYFPDAPFRRYVQIQVSDTGTGMDKETRERIFEPFFTTKELGKGTGLGLSVVFGVVKSHRGYINVESEVGSGTTFVIYLPVPEDEIGITEESYLSDMNIPGGTETILVVEDEQMLRDLVETTLTSKGYTVLMAEDGIRGFELFQLHNSTIAAIFTDIGLPGMSGIDLAKKILQISPKAKIIVASGFLDPEIKSDMDKNCLKYFIQKPYMPDVVLHTVRSAIDEALQ